MPPDSTPSFDSLLKRLRRAASMTQMELATRAGFSAVYISMLERGARRPTRTTAALLADALNISAQERRRRRWLQLLSCNRGHPSGVRSGDGRAGGVSWRLTLLCTGIESPARLPQAPGESYADVLAAQREMVRTTVAAHGGAEMYNQGAASCFVFPRARDALTAAAAAQRALAAHAWPVTVPARVRMGLHSGEPRLGAAGYVGIGVRRATWIAAAGYGGQVLLSAVPARWSSMICPTA